MSTFKESKFTFIAKKNLLLQEKRARKAGVLESFRKLILFSYMNVKC